MLCLVRYLFVISTSVIDCLERFVPEMTYYVSSGTLNLTKHTHSLTHSINQSLVACRCLLSTLGQYHRHSCCISEQAQ